MVVSNGMQTAGGFAADREVFGHKLLIGEMINVDNLSKRGVCG